ncbi:MAG TPA: hypothetical protein VIR14_03140 [Gaiellaceae bacterium]
MAATATGPKAATKTSSSLRAVQSPLFKVGTGTLTGSAPASTVPTGLQNEVDPATLSESDASNGGGDGETAGTNRTLPGAVKGNGHAIKSSAMAKANGQLGANWQGLNFHDQRFANGGNQFSVEPPDQGLCAGNGFVVETVNDVAQVYDTSGNALLNGGNAVDLNTFYGYPAAIDRVGGTGDGPEITDPSCIYDAGVNRFFMVVLTIDRLNRTSAFAGTDHLDLAVSDTGDPTGTWTIYSIPVQDDGTQGTPDDGCFLNRQLAHGPCLGDYPHIGSDANGIYLTTNEFSLMPGAPGFFGSQIYALSKQGLADGTISTFLHFNTLGAGPDGAGFTVWPAQSAGANYATDNNGTEYFLSSRAVFADDGTSTDILQWTLTNTASLNTATPDLSGTIRDIPVDEYAVPGLARQPTGNHPLGDCIADTTVHPTCNLTVAGINTHDNSTFQSHSLNANDSRMQQVMYANGKLWGALDTAVTVDGHDRAGIAYYVVNPNSGKVVVQGQLGASDTDYTYPAIGVLQNGRGVMAFTLTGDTNYPSAAFTSIDANVGAGPVHIANAGAGAWDGFTQYVKYGAGRPRWGDYGAAAPMGNSIWIASEDVEQTCDYATYFADPTCGGTRGALSNWATHVSQVTP